MKGFITFEGCEGVGKSTQIRMLREYFEQNKINAVFTREPGGVPICENIRSIILNKDFSEMSPICETLLYASSRAQLVSEVIKPNLDMGRIVVCDRYIDSSFAYQGYARGLGIDFVESINFPAIGDVVPELTIFLDLPPEQAFSRKGGRDVSDRMEREDLDFHKRVYKGYKTVSEKYSDRVVCIAPTGTRLDTHKAIVKTLKDRGII